ncbi:MAG: 3'-5' exonuclease domain-containing protein 2 [Dysgonamonadaceae bacterium]|jgi:ribonuclease D|nr:3'-5' exonuclease domain-containing protein 2 [Dysgonamonadaceae bacterium]
MKIEKSQIAELPLETFPGKIVVVDNVAGVQAAVDYLSHFSPIGFDTETKPAFQRGVIHKVALLQLSTEDKCFLFRLNKIGYPDALDAIICNADIQKIGLSLRDDFAAIRKRVATAPDNFLDLQSFVKQFDIEDLSLQKIYALIFGKKLSKNQRLSNWGAPYLTPAQQSYAALDAWACLRIYNYLNATKNHSINL